ncbi:MAG: T9SS type A sorting domain-containing protein [Bacteroidia bacterium]
MRLNVIILFAAISLTTFGQTIDRSVVSSGGKLVSNSSMLLEYTVGEVAVTEYSRSSIVITEGFNQAEDKKSNTSVSTVNSNGSVKVYPNPASKILTISTKDGYNGAIFDISGQKVMEVSAIAGQTIIDVSDLTSGVYLLRLTDDSGVPVIVRWVKQ